MQTNPKLEKDSALTEMILAESQKDTWGPNSLVFYGEETRSILLSGEINQQLSDSICSQIRELFRVAPNSPITTYINTPGGSIIDALAIYDLLRMISCPVFTIVQGACFSAGLLILSAGDYRFASKNSSFFYHQPILDSADIVSKEIIESTKQMYMWSLNTMDSIIRKRCGMSHKQYEKHFAGKIHKHFGAEEALAYGLIDEISGYSKKKIKGVTHG
jgi:ATP-dependent Clp protease protease subunit